MSESSLTVLQVIPRMGFGEAEKDTLEYALALKEAGGYPIVVSAGGLPEKNGMPSGLIVELRRQGIEHVEMPVDSKNFFKMFLNAFRLARLIKKRHVDVIHARSRAPAWSARLAAKKTGAPFATTFYGPYSLGFLKLKRFYNAVMTKSDTVVTSSDFIKKHVMETYKVPAEKIAVLPPGIDETRFDVTKISMDRMIFQANKWHIPDDLSIIVYPAPLSKNKGQTLLLKAISKMKNRRVHCFFIGRAKHEANVKKFLKKARQTGVEAQVQFIEEDVCSETAYAMADTVVYVPERDEAFSRTVLEAQAMSRIVVASDNGGIGESVRNGVSGFVTAAKDADSLAETLDKVLALTFDERQKITRTAKSDLLKKHARKNTHAAIVGFYQSLLKKKARTT